MRKCGIDTWNMFEQRHEDPINITCQEPATMPVYELNGKTPMGKLCPKHAKEFDQLRLGVNAFVGAKYVSRN